LNFEGTELDFAKVRKFEKLKELAQELFQVEERVSKVEALPVIRTDRDAFLYMDIRSKFVTFREAGYSLVTKMIKLSDCFSVSANDESVRMGFSIRVWKE
jgi:hypothetical protein